MKNAIKELNFNGKCTEDHKEVKKEVKKFFKIQFEEKE